MLRQAALLPMMLLPLLLPLAAAAAPAPMEVTGVARANGVPAPVGALVAVQVGPSGAPFANATVGANGTFTLVVPADDPDTSVQEGAVAGDILRFRVMGSDPAAPSVLFAPGGRAAQDVNADVPEVALERVAVPDGPFDQGQPIPVEISVANRGRAVARNVVVSILDDGRVVGAEGLGDMLPNTAQPNLVVRVATAGLVGDRTLQVVARGTSGEALEGNNVALAPVRVIADDAPVITGFGAVPASPLAEEAITLSVEANDSDGIAYAHFFWESPAGADSINISKAPFRAVIGAFPAGATVRYWVVVGDAGGAGKTAQTEAQALVVRDPRDPSPQLPSGAPALPTPKVVDVDVGVDEGETPAAGVEERTSETPGPGAAAVLVAAAGSAFALAYFRRRT